MMGSQEFRALHQFQTWAQGFTPEPRPWDFLSNVSGASATIMATSLIYPRFLQVEGCTILEEQYDKQSFRTWFEHFNGDVANVERMINHLHLWDLFKPSKEEISDDIMRAFGSTLEITWALAAEAQFPGRNMQGSFDWEEVDYGPTITVFSG